jgi:hypothetical protein
MPSTWAMSVSTPDISVEKSYVDFSRLVDQRTNRVQVSTREQLIIYGRILIELPERRGTMEDKTPSK